jgi:hypothetical protein
MQRAFSLQPHEINQAQQIDEERKTVLAQIGALTLDMETARAQLPVVEQKRRQYLANLVQLYGITDYRAARLEGGNLICDLPDAPQAQAPPDPPLPAPRVNGGLERIAKE